MVRYKTRAVEVGARELTDGRNITELILVGIYGGVGERQGRVEDGLPLANVKITGVFLLYGMRDELLKGREIG
jgi:hypothetical protein